MASSGYVKAAGCSCAPLDQTQLQHLWLWWIYSGLWIQQSMLICVCTTSCRLSNVPKELQDLVDELQSVPEDQRKKVSTCYLAQRLTLC